MRSEPPTSDSVRIFISSPGDVAEERALARRVVERLQGEYGSRALLEPVFWEHEPLRATASWHEQILSPAEADIVICILWARLGTRQPAEITRPDGSRYHSGTEYEFEEAWRAFQEKGQPDLLVYRKTKEPRVSLRDKAELMERVGQKESLDRFIDTWFQNREEGTLIAAFHPFESSGDFEELFEVHLRKLLDQRLPNVTKVGTRTKTWTEGSPFRGLNTFEFDHAPIFFGRTKAVSEVLEALRVQADHGRPFVLVLGMSGCGKSSLVRAGVLPLLTQPNVIEGVGLWRWAVMRPGDTGADPFAALAAALMSQEALPELGADGTGAEELSSLLRESPEAAFPLLKGGLSQAASELARAENLESQPEARLALVVDQLEELFTSSVISAEERQRFTRTLRSLVASGKVWVLATLRSDFYSHSTELPALVELKEGSGQYDLMPPTAAEIGQMIRQPAQLAGLVFEENKETGERLDDTLRDAAARNPEALPLLQFTLEELYTARDAEGTLALAAYAELGGVGGALAQRAEAAFESLHPDERAALPAVLSRLVTVGANHADGATRRRAPLEDFAQASPERALVDRFVDARLCVTDRDEHGRAVVAVAHEALIDHWPRLREWLAHNRELLRMRERLDAAAEQWEAEGRPASYLLASAQRLAEAEELERAEGIEIPEREHAFLQASLARGRRTRWLKRVAVAALGVLAVLAAAGAWIANTKRQEAEVARGESEAVTDFLSDMLAAVNPEKLGRDVLVKDVLDEASTKIDELADQPLIQARLMNTIGSVYMKLGLYDDATPLLLEALSTQEALLEPDDPDLFDYLNNLGVLYARQAKFAEAAPLFQRSLTITERTLGPDHPDVAGMLHNLGNIFAAQGKYEEAGELFQRSLRIREEVLGADHSDVGNSLGNLGALYTLLGRYEEAAQMLLRSLEIREKALGPEHPWVGQSLNNLASVYLEQGKFAEAEPLYLRALEVFEKTSGPDHPDVAHPLHGLGNVLRDQQRYGEAGPLYERALALRERSLESNHPDLVELREDYAALLRATGRNEDAEVLEARGEAGQAEADQETL